MLFSHKLRSCSPRLFFCCFHDLYATAAYHEAASLDRDNGNPHMAARSPARGSAQRPWNSCCRRSVTSAAASSIVSGDRWRPDHAAAVASLEFGYDPMSYALNFEDDWSQDLDEEFPVRNFSARLPVSLERLLLAKLSKEVVAYS